MRILLQRVSRAKVIIHKQEKANISAGFLIFVAFCNDDSIDDIKWSILKIINLRVFNDLYGKMNKSLLQNNGEDI